MASQSQTAMQFQALLGEETFDIDLSHGEVRQNGEEVAARLHRLSEHTVHLLVDNRSYVLTLQFEEERKVRVTHAGQSQIVFLKNERDLLLERMGIGADAALAAEELRAPMPGLVLQILVEPGQKVSPGDGLIVLEAMKMENELRADSEAVVGEIHVTQGAPVGKGDLLVSFES